MRNRQTADTLEGIARWRLLDQYVEKSIHETRAALAWLVDRGYLEEIRVPGGTNPIFRLVPKRLDAAAKLIGSGKQK